MAWYIKNFFFWKLEGLEGGVSLPDECTEWVSVQFSYPSSVCCQCLWAQTIKVLLLVLYLFIWNKSLLLSHNSLWLSKKEDISFEKRFLKYRLCYFFVYYSNGYLTIMILFCSRIWLLPDLSSTCKWSEPSLLESGRRPGVWTEDFFWVINKWVKRMKCITRKQHETH